MGMPTPLGHSRAPCAGIGRDAIAAVAERTCSARITVITPNTRGRLAASSLTV